MLALYVEAPFAAFRTFTAGWYRPTATFLTPSAAYGLLLNLAGVESRLCEDDLAHNANVPTTLMRPGLPPIELAVGVPEFRIRHGTTFPCGEEWLFPHVQTVFQQLHNYPVGTSGADRAEAAKGNKYNITPVRRELLSNLCAVIAMRRNDQLIDDVRRGLAGKLDVQRYGVPFLGDNAFLPDRLEILASPGAVRWYERVGPAADSGVRSRATRMTIMIDRADLSQTRTELFAPQDRATDAGPTELAWTRIDPPARVT